MTGKPPATPPVFRGFTAAASLKDDGPSTTAWASSRVFRGFTAAASLKAQEMERNGTRLGRFPRFHRRGLIEGSIAMK